MEKGRELITPSVASNPITVISPKIPTDPKDMKIGTPVTERNTVIKSAIVPKSREDITYSTCLSFFIIIADCIDYLEQHYQRSHEERKGQGDFSGKIVDLYG